MNDERVILSQIAENENFPDMDWSKVDLPAPKNPRPQCGELGDLDYWKMVVASKLIKKSIAAMIQTAVYTYLSRNWEEHEKRLQIEATREGVTPEEMFMKLSSEDK
ncbi:MAG: hypothetical protein KME16_27555 [Scytolyngbya sp. HA4215-MV1]|nr:hypothetical protein [Scytolyngbya sp. HA4215-MV1]